MANERFWELDFLRGVALVLMAAFHFLYDLRFFGFGGLDLGVSFWFFSPRIIASIFIFLVGVSLSVSYSRSEAGLAGNALFVKYLRRGAGVFFWGLVITIVTWFYVRDEYVVFGILHFIGLSIVLSYPFRKWGYRNLFLGLACIVAGVYLVPMSFSFPYLLFLGYVLEGFSSLDYFPLLPWFGVVLIGLFTGRNLYPSGARKYVVPDYSNNFAVSFFCLLGRHSLLFYLLHQPVLISVLLLLGIVPQGFL
jgi:uncharacterized membrane protein